MPADPHGEGTPSDHSSGTEIRPDETPIEIADIRQNKRRWLLPAWLGSLLLVSALLLVVGSKIKSPSQAAATAKAPPPTLITAALSEQVLSQSTVLRANVALSAPVSLGTPTLPSGSLPVATSISKQAGDAVHSGDVLAGISGRPIFVFQGQITAYRTIELGDSGADVTELQRALIGDHHGIGSDTQGTYGPGTATAVEALYQSAGYVPIQSLPDASAASSTGSTDTGSTSSTPTSSQSTDTQAASTTTTAPITYATVPLGEIDFLPTLPATVEATSLKLGAAVTGLVSSSSAGQSPVNSTATEIYTLGSGGVTLSGQIDVPDSHLLRPGMQATVNDDVNGGQWTASVTNVIQPDQTEATESGLSEATVVLSAVPTDPIPQSELGQNVRVTIREADTGKAVLAAPISAIYAHANGLSYVTVLKDAKQTPVTINVGLEANGMVQITPVGATLEAGDQVVVGSGSGAGPQS